MAKRIILGLLALLFVGLIGLGGHFALKQQRRVKAFSAKTTATVLGKQVVRRSIRTSGETTCYHRPVVTFRFQAQGRTFSSSSIFPHEFEVGGNLGSIFAKAPLERFEVGQETTAYCNPNDPKQACLIRRPSFNPYALILGSTIALGMVVMVLLAAWPLPPQSAVKRLRALSIAVLWHAIGLASVVHYFYLAGFDYGGHALLLFGIYTLLGLFPIGAALNLAGNPVQGAALVSLLGTFFGFWVGAAVAFVAGRFFRVSATLMLQCMGYGMAIPAVLLPIVGLFVKGDGSRGEDEGGQEEGAAQEG